MGIIFGDDIKTKFLTQWSTNVPAIITYGESTGKKPVNSILRDLEKTGWYTVNIIMYMMSPAIFFLPDDTSMQVSSLKIISLSLAKGLQSLKFLYDEYNVSQIRTGMRLLCALNL